MDLQASYLKFLQEKRRPWWGSLLFEGLKALSFLFLAVWWVRRTLYRYGLRRRLRLPCPVVSVGNLTTGGTGKTPIVIHLAEHFTRKGLRVAVLSRGYGRQKAGSLVWVSDGKTLLASPELGGDEPVLIAKSVPQAAVLVCKDRYRAGLEALKKFKPDLILLDDGFQRRFRLHRDLDILVLDGANPFSTGYPLPAGLLREPLHALGEADVMVLNKVNMARNPGDIRTILKRHNPRAFLVESRYRSQGLRDLRSGKEVKASALDQAPVGAFSGLADHLSFIRTLADHRVLVRHSYPLQDHFAYTKENLKDILGEAKLRGLRFLVTTEKDEVKLPKDLDLPIPILVLEIQWEVTQGRDHWDTILKNISLASSKV